jgi:hypothetical protein
MKLVLCGSERIPNKQVLEESQSQIGLHPTHPTEKEKEMKLVVCETVGIPNKQVLEESHSQTPLHYTHYTTPYRRKKEREKKLVLWIPNKQVLEESHSQIGRETNS